MDQKVCDNPWHLKVMLIGYVLVGKWERSVTIEESNFAWYVRNSIEPLIEGVKAAETIEYNDAVDNK